MNLNEFRDRAHENAKAKGFHDSGPPNMAVPMAVSIMIRVLADVVERDRCGEDMGPAAAEICTVAGSIASYAGLTPDRVREIGSRPHRADEIQAALDLSERGELLDASAFDDIENLKEEMADIWIRNADYAGQCGIDIEAEVKKKMEKNEARPKMHGGKTW